MILCSQTYHRIHVPLWQPFDYIHSFRFNRTFDFELSLLEVGNDKMFGYVAKNRKDTASLVLSRTTLVQLSTLGTIVSEMSFLERGCFCL